ncbi:unnamed protein product [Peronospora destructor]|uniref:60S ribosome subunit biogenesis protein NIP7 pre-PUA domain-containing protein n=1 Tax=Peronospora destructor TaxID=86335 RepID=A0AAV0UVV9_9STRA|nr:unnamed protein product [Peronospora destructor]
MRPLTDYYEKLMRQSTNVGTDELLSIGTAVGKLTKSKKFHLRITFLDYLAQYAKYKVWIKPNSRDVLLALVSPRKRQSCAKTWSPQPYQWNCTRADIGEYLRIEDEMF